MPPTEVNVRMCENFGACMLLRWFYNAAPPGTECAWCNQYTLKRTMYQIRDESPKLCTTLRVLQSDDVVPIDTSE